MRRDVSTFVRHFDGSLTASQRSRLIAVDILSQLPTFSMSTDEAFTCRGEEDALTPSRMANVTFFWASNVIKRICERHVRIFACTATSAVPREYYKSFREGFFSPVTPRSSFRILLGYQSVAFDRQI
jgi:hypothetical protein